MATPFLSSEEYDERAHRYYDDGDYDAALDTLKEALRLYPHSVELYVGLGYTRLAREEFVWAKQAFERALVLDPEHEDGLVGMGEALLRIGHRRRRCRLFRVHGHGLRRGSGAAADDGAGAVPRAAVRGGAEVFEEAVDAAPEQCGGGGGAGVHAAPSGGGDGGAAAAEAGAAPGQRVPRGADLPRAPAVRPGGLGGCGAGVRAGPAGGALGHAGDLAADRAEAGAGEPGAGRAGAGVWERRLEEVEARRTRWTSCWRRSRRARRPAEGAVAEAVLVGPGGGGRGAAPCESCRTAA
jgi:hypothetical protein